MTIRTPAYGSDLEPLVKLIYGHPRSRGKVKPGVARSRVAQCIKRGNTNQGIFTCALVSEVSGRVTGFLYAEERNAFDLAHGVTFIEVHFLIGRNCAVPLLKELRARTKKRILVPQWNILVTENTFKRLIGPLGPQRMATVYQI